MNKLYFSAIDDANIFERKIVKSIRQFIRYGLFGLASNGLIYCIYIFITSLGVEPKLAMTAVFLVGAFVGFVGNRRWTFSHVGSPSKAAFRYVVSYLVAYGLNYSSMWLAVDRMGIPHYIVQAVNTVLISVLLFMAQKYWIFPDSATGDGKDNSAVSKEGSGR